MIKFKKKKTKNWIKKVKKLEKKPKEPVKNPKEHITTNLANNFLYRILFFIYI